MKKVFFIYFLMLSNVSAQTSKLKTEVMLSLEQTTMVDVLRLFNISPKELKRRAVFYYDTEEQQLLEKNVLIRSRWEDQKDNFTVKVRPFDPSGLGDEWFNIDGFKCERDILPRKESTACSLKLPVKRQDLKQYHRRPIYQNLNKVLMPEQEVFLKALGQVIINKYRLVAYGPAYIFYWKGKVVGIDEKIKLEFWTIGSKENFIEISFRPKKFSETSLKSLIRLVESRGLKYSVKSISKSRRVIATGLHGAYEDIKIVK